MFLLHSGSSFIQSLKVQQLQITHKNVHFKMTEWEEKEVRFLQDSVNTAVFRSRGKILLSLGKKRQRNVIVGLSFRLSEQQQQCMRV